MTKGERDFKLELFLRFVDKGENTPKYLMDYVAGGVREFMREGKPWQIGKGGRPRRPYITALKCKALAESGVSVDRIALILNMASEDGKDYTKRIKRLKDDVKGVFDKTADDYTSLCFIIDAADELIAENQELTRQECKALEDLKARLNAPWLIDEVEPQYGR
jgi:hypothetical protein